MTNFESMIFQDGRVWASNILNILILDPLLINFHIFVLVFGYAWFCCIYPCISMNLCIRKTNRRVGGGGGGWFYIPLFQMSVFRLFCLSSN